MKHRITFILAFTALLCRSQNPLHCGADEMRIGTLRQNPAIAKAVIKRDEQLEAFTKAYAAGLNPAAKSTNTTTATYIIPVVFHIIHNYGAENISDAQVKDGIDILNKTFRKQLADTASIVQQFKSLHADCDIEFRLAQKDPNGNCHSGINRIASSLTTIGDHSVKALIHWPPNQYLNIYVVANAAGLAGHCVWPSDADTIPAWDGIVIGYNYVGSIGASNYTQSVALAHECGHYLNLQHIWGGNNVPDFYYYPCADPNKDCNIDDLVSDTPPTIGWLTCNLNGASCGNTVDNVQNAMDYSYCNRMFTYGQKTRMHACLNSAIAGRNNLWQPANLAATGVLNIPGPLCHADFTANKTVVCQNSGNQVTFTNTSYNGTLTSVSWSFPGGTPSSSTASSVTVTYSTSGTYNVQLKVKNNTDSAMVTKTNFITVLSTSSTAYPFAEGFEASPALHGPDWYINSLDTLNQWQITGAAAYSGQKSIMLNNMANTMNTNDELIGKMINLSGVSAMNLSFRYAFARKDTTNKDQLRVYMSSSCTGSWLLRATLSGTVLETAAPTTGSFVPGGAGEWKQATFSVPGSWLTSTFRFKFVFISAGGNNIYIDDINLDAGAGVNDLYESISQVNVYPNPSSGHIQVGFTLTEPKKLELSVVNTMGQEVYKGGQMLYMTGEHQVGVDINQLPAGAYFLKISEHGRDLTKPLIITQN
ncbi:MAG: T9SS type A sorting domain-containing protein [Bacteroidetes bacterium]|nr:T9SS type A sorting domain-containing protein [Bacteroidota bacterium]